MSKTEVCIRLRKLPVNQSWVFLFGRTIEDATILEMGSRRIFESRDAAVTAATAHGLKVTESGEVM